MQARQLPDSLAARYLADERCVCVRSAFNFRRRKNMLAGTQRRCAVSCDRFHSRQARETPTVAAVPRCLASTPAARARGTVDGPCCGAGGTFFNMCVVRSGRMSAFPQYSLVQSVTTTFRAPSCGAGEKSQAQTVDCKICVRVQKARRDGERKSISRQLGCLAGQSWDGALLSSCVC